MPILASGLLPLMPEKLHMYLPKLVLIMGLFFSNLFGYAQCLCEQDSFEKCLKHYEDRVREMIESGRVEEDCILQIQDLIAISYSNEISTELQLGAHNLRIDVGILANDYYSTMLDLAQFMEIQLNNGMEYGRPEIMSPVDDHYLDDAESFAWALYYDHQGQYVKSINKLRQCVKSEHIRGSRQAFIVTWKHALSASRAIGSFDEGLIYAKERLRYTQREYSDDYFLLGECMNDLGMVLLEKGDYDLVDVYLDSSLVLRQRLPVDVSYGPVGNAYDSKGTYYLAIKEYELALRQFELALEQFLLFGKIGYSPDVAVCLSNIGLCYKNMDMLPEAIEAYNQSLLWFDKIKGQHYQYTAHIHLRLSELYLQQEQFNQARQWLHQSETDLDSIGFRSPEMTARIQLVEFKIAESNQDGEWNLDDAWVEMNGIVSQAAHGDNFQIPLLCDLHIERLNFHIRHEVQAHKLILEEAVELDKRVNSEMLGLSSAGNVLASAHYRKFIGALLEYIDQHQTEMSNSDWQTLVELVESAKGTLKRKYRFEHLVRTGSAEEREAFGQIVNEITAYERKLNTLGSNTNGHLKDRLRLFELYDARNDLLEETGWDVGEVNIDHATTGLHFFVGDHRVYRIERHNGRIALMSICTSAELEQLTKAYYEAIDTTSSQHYSELAFGMSELLIRDVDVSKLDIYGDGVLEGMPFDALLRSTDGRGEYWELDYWLYHSTFRYPDVNDWSGITGFSAVIADYQSLPGAKDESEMIETVFGRLELESLDEFKGFLQEHKRLDLVHLAVHGQHDVSNPLAGYLLIPNDEGSLDTLEGHELLALPIQGLLASVAACESGMSSTMSNHENLSLSSFFQASGFANTITSSWQANDYSTSEIFQSFYEMMGAGHDMVDALQESKKLFLKANGAQHAAPKYWAHLKLNGNGGKLLAEGTSRSWFWLFLLAIPIYLIWRRRSAA